MSFQIVSPDIVLHARMMMTGTFIVYLGIAPLGVAAKTAETL